MECSPQPGKNLDLSGGQVCFNPCFNGMLSATGITAFDAAQERIVSILVLMECSPQPVPVGISSPVPGGFNPCFNGMLSATFPRYCSRRGRGCFNPCFNGMLSATFLFFFHFPSSLFVSILVLMECSPQLS